MAQILMSKGSEIISVPKAEVAAKKKQGYNVTSKYAQKRLPKDKSEKK